MTLPDQPHGPISACPQLRETAIAVAQLIHLSAETSHRCLHPQTTANKSSDSGDERSLDHASRSSRGQGAQFSEHDQDRAGGSRTPPSQALTYSPVPAEVAVTDVLVRDRPVAAALVPSMPAIQTAGATSNPGTSIRVMARSGCHG